jgi:hypothetical protein
MSMIMDFIHAHPERYTSSLGLGPTLRYSTPLEYFTRLRDARGRDGHGVAFPVITGSHFLPLVAGGGPWSGYYSGYPEIKVCYPSDAVPNDSFISPYHDPYAFLIRRRPASPIVCCARRRFSRCYRGRGA